jgi:tetratricopeptide (TPR) repeat protein
MTTIDNLGLQISFDYLRALEWQEAVKPLYRALPTIYVPAVPEVHSLQPWAYFRPPPKTSLAAALAVFTHDKIVPSVESIEVDEEKKKKFEAILCDTDEEREEKEKIKNLLFTLKNMSETLRMISEQTVQYSVGPLEIFKGVAEDEIRYHTLIENRQKAYSYVRLGKFRLALPYLENIVEQSPENVQDLKVIGMVLLHIYRATDAIVYLRKSLEMDPGDAHVQINLASAYFDVGAIADGLSLCYPLKNHPDLYISQNALDLIAQFEEHASVTNAEV